MNIPLVCKIKRLRYRLLFLTRTPARRTIRRGHPRLSITGVSSTIGFVMFTFGGVIVVLTAKNKNKKLLVLVWPAQACGISATPTAAQLLLASYLLIIPLLVNLPTATLVLPMRVRMGLGGGKTCAARPRASASFHVCCWAGASALATALIKRATCPLLRARIYQ